MPPLESCFGHQAQPGGALAAVLELGGVCNGGDESRGGERADALDLSKPLAQRIGAAQAFDSMLVHIDALLELNELLVQIAKQLHGQRRQRLAGGIQQCR